VTVGSMRGRRWPPFRRSARQATKGISLYDPHARATEKRRSVEPLSVAIEARSTSGMSAIVFMKYVVGRAMVLQAIPVSNTSTGDQTIPLFTKGRLSGRPQAVDPRKSLRTVCSTRPGADGAKNSPKVRATGSPADPDESPIADTLGHSARSGRAGSISSGPT